MKTIIYRKSDLFIAGQLQYNYPKSIDNTFAWEIENNVIPNFGGTKEDYATLETKFTRFHLEKNDFGEVVAVEDGLTIEEQRNVILGQMTQLDNPRDAESIFDVLKAKGILSENDLPEATRERFAQKKLLRQQLQNL